MTKPRKPASFRLEEIEVVDTPLPPPAIPPTMAPAPAPMAPFLASLPVLDPASIVIFSVSIR